MRAERALLMADGKTALAEASRAVSVAPKDAASRLAYADAHALLGHHDQAMAEYRRTLELCSTGGPGSAPPDRIAEVKRAVANDALPAPRHAPSARSHPAANQRSRPAPKQRSRPSESFDAFF
jgi:predicted TPR repeat methyltransferase